MGQYFAGVKKVISGCYFFFLIINAVVLIAKITITANA